MALTEGARAVYGVPASNALTYGSWYGYYARPDRRAADRRARVQRQAAKLTQLPDPGMINTTGRGGATRVSGAQRAGRMTTTRGIQGLSPEFQAQVRGAQQSGMLDEDLMPTQIAYGNTSSAPGLYQMDQARRQERDGLYNEIHMRDPGNWPTEEIARLQRQMVKAGILASKFHLGVFDNATASAYEGLLSMANSNGGKTKNEMLSQLIATNPDDLMSQYRKPEFVAPDRAALVEDVESVFEQRLGRTPTADERRHLAQHYMQEFRREYRLETLPTARNQFIGGAFNEAQQQLGLTPEEATVTNVDPSARFASYFRQRYKDEEAEIKRRAEQREAGATATQAFEQLRGMMGAGGVQQLG